MTSFLFSGWTNKTNINSTEALYGGFGWHREEVIATYGQDVITVYHIVSFGPDS